MHVESCRFRKRDAREIRKFLENFSLSEQTPMVTGPYSKGKRPCHNTRDVSRPHSVEVSVGSVVENVITPFSEVHSFDRKIFCRSKHETLLETGTRLEGP